MKKIVFALAFVCGAALIACGGATTGAPQPSRETTSIDPCGPSDCPPCDETKQKCMGPMVCDGHPEKAKRVCERGSDGKCASRLACE